MQLSPSPRQFEKLLSRLRDEKSAGRRAYEPLVKFKAPLCGRFMGFPRWNLRRRWATGCRSSISSDLHCKRSFPSIPGLAVSAACRSSKVFWRSCLVNSTGSLTLPARSCGAARCWMRRSSRRRRRSRPEAATTTSMPPLDIATRPPGRGNAPYRRANHFQLTARSLPHLTFDSRCKKMPANAQE